MLVRDAVVEGTNLLKHSAETPFLDAVLLLSEASGSSKEHLFAHYSDELPKATLSLFREFLERRLAGIPVSYIRQRKEFYSLQFIVDERVLVPRPDTEILVDAALAFCDSLDGTPAVHDCCTGSGCIGITLKHERPSLDVSVSDLSGEALEIFTQNSRDIVGTVLPNFRSDLLESVIGSFDLIVANPPYLTSRQTDTLEAGGCPEPMLALDGGEDGLDFHRKLIVQAAELLRAGGCLLLEADPDQMDRLGSVLARNAYGTIMTYNDIAGRKRVIQGRR